MIAIGNDHGGLELKDKVIEFLKEKNIDFKDFGTNTTDSVDYPDYAKKVAESIISKECAKGILICGTGIGISLAANKISGIRAAVCTNTFMARMSKEHNDANILALGERVLGPGVAIDIIDAWLNASFTGGRHKTRVDKISALEKI